MKTGTLLAALIALGVVGAAQAQTAGVSSGLGQPWPNAADVSANPNWHVYVFVLNGIEYVQVNDLNGTVHAAVGATGGITFALPVGVDSQSVNTATAASSTSTTTVYSDSTTTVTATPQSNGTTTFSAVPTPGLSCQPGGGVNCGGGRGG